MLGRTTMFASNALLLSLILKMKLAALIVGKFM
jgi:hypothetical protein